MNHNRINQIMEFLITEPEDPFLQYSMALEYLKIDMDKDARKIFENLLKSNKDYLPTYYQLGKLYEKLNLSPRAIITYQEGLIVAERQKNLRAIRELKESLNNLTGDE